ncbi:hypothetical protein [Streptomyces tsukubensis]|uniref:Lipoprotein n=1 Tax=Streptomyces tsukubensis TaxID=83656 RepID=A0A1V4A2F1_9ACTN|nr:hypothetical protein [Streptomyces tsukubensis]OON72724.1 hypothetical protein B1H18_28640 [Streptomyces tsukubensis]QFR96818.1 hypothetical protein GBW32_32005 [Streptomyces tsukubensis]
MRAIRVASTALLSACALTLSVTAASAEGSGGGDITSFGFSVTPSTIAAGGQVTLSVNGCDHKVMVSSGVFDSVTIPKGKSEATAVVDTDAKPGAMYEVTFDCDGEEGTTDLTIATGNPHEGGHHDMHKGVKAGTGGSLAGFDLHELGLGAALIAGGLGSAYYWTRRRSGNQGS